MRKHPMSHILVDSKFDMVQHLGLHMNADIYASSREGIVQPIALTLTLL
jgi:hypothetical protein